MVAIVDTTFPEEQSKMVNLNEKSFSSKMTVLIGSVRKLSHRKLIINVTNETDFQDGKEEVQQLFLLGINYNLNQMNWVMRLLKGVSKNVYFYQMKSLLEVDIVWKWILFNWEGTIE